VSSHHVLCSPACCSFFCLHLYCCLQDDQLFQQLPSTQAEYTLYIFCKILAKFKLALIIFDVLDCTDSAVVLVLGLSKVPASVLLFTSIRLLCFGAVHRRLFLLRAKHQSLALGSGLSSSFFLCSSLPVVVFD